MVENAADVKVVLICEESDTLLAQELEEATAEQRALGRRLVSFAMTHERYSDGVSSYLAVAVFERVVEPGNGPK